MKNKSSTVYCMIIMHKMLKGACTIIYTDFQESFKTTRRQAYVLYTYVSAL